MKMPIGGYFELELRSEGDYHNHAIKLNSARNCFQYILIAKNYTKVYLPYYICEVMLHPINTLGIDFEFYYIDENLDPIFDKSIKGNEAFLYVNYYGIKQNTVEQLSKKVANLIVDNSQAFYANVLDNIDTFFSPRKFFGVPDGGLLYTNSVSDGKYEKDVSYNRMNHLLVRRDIGAEEGYSEFVKNDKSLDNQPILTMSTITSKLLASIDYKKGLKTRNRNFICLNNKLQANNKLKINTESVAPMVYPYYIDNGCELRKKLIENKIFVATYWENILSSISSESIEYDLVKNLVPLPIDQRLNEDDLNRILDLI